MLLRRLRLIAVGCIAALLATATPVWAHCDGLDGPVVAAARKALEARDPNGVLIWVQPDDEAELREAFRQALVVRRLGGEPRALADRHFFETLVRLHRAGEGAPYTGLKPAGRDLGPAIPLADAAVASGSPDAVAGLLAREITEGIRVRLADVQRKRNFDPRDLAAGRSYVASYVSFVHYVEAIHAASQSSAEGHYDVADEAPVHHER